MPAIPLPPFERISEIVKGAEDEQAKYGTNRSALGELARLHTAPDEVYGTGFTSDMTSHSPPAHRRPLTAMPDPSDRAVMPPEQQDLFDAALIAPGKARAALVAARAYNGGPYRQKSEHPLVRHASPSNLRTRIIGEGITRLRDAAGRLRINRDVAAREGRSFRAGWYGRRVRRREKAALRIGTYLVGEWQSKL